MDMKKDTEQKQFSCLKKRKKVFNQEQGTFESCKHLITVTETNSLFV